MADRSSMVSRPTDPWNGSGPAEAMAQIAGLTGKRFTGMKLKLAPERFDAQRQDGEPGVVSVRGLLQEDTIVLTVELARCPAATRVGLKSLLQRTAALNDRVRLAPPQEAEGAAMSVLAELKVQATPLSLARETSVLTELDKLDEFAQELQRELPAHATAPDLQKLYEPFADVLSAVLPHQAAGTAASVSLWARETLEFLNSGASVAVATDSPITLQYGLAILADAAQGVGVTLASVVLPSLNARALIELSGRAPGVVAVPAVRLSLATSIYELANESQAMLGSLAAARRPVLFTGTLAELQSVFHGGQGGRSDPLFPVLRHVPDIELPELIRFAIRDASQQAGGLSPTAAAELADDTLQALAPYGPAEQRRVLPLLINWLIQGYSRRGRPSRPAVTEYLASVAQQRETLAGLCTRPRGARSPEVQERFARVLADPGLLRHLQQHLLGQDAALEELVRRLQTESLTRPPHQPLRYCAEGPPAAGKSQSAVLLAERLGIPYVNIDLASMPDHYTASSQLLGSARGIVGSHQPGRLEQAAKHYAGCVVEVSDLDHAPPAVRATVGDLFLQLLETGESQSATGAVFSVANLLFAFTMNLPGQGDKEVRKGFGFVDRRTRADIRRDVEAELKGVLSTALQSRLGTPILFEPLDQAALAAIIERALIDAVKTAAERLGQPVQDVVCGAGVGASLLAADDPDAEGSGARGLLEIGRAHATAALLRLVQNNAAIAQRVLRVSLDAHRQVTVDLQ